MAITLDGTSGITTPAETVQGALTTTGNTILGDASTDTLNVGNGGLVKDASGNVGIGTASPGGKLDIRGNTNGNILAGVYNDSTAASSQAYMQISAGARYANLTANYTNTYFINAGVGLTTSYQDYDTQIYRNNAGTERMRIDSSGNLLVGGTSAYGTNPKITVVGGVTISISNSNYRNIYMSGDTNLYFNNGTNQGYLSSAGAWTNASDARLKKDIVEIKYGLQSVLNTKPRSYNRVDVAGEYIGFVAQELKEVIPEVVSGDPEVQFGVDYGSLVAVAFKAIQEQQVLITQLQADVAALKALSA